MKKKVTFYLPEELVRATRVRAARTDQRESDVVAATLRSYLGFDVLDLVRARSDLTETVAMGLVASEIHAMRAERRAARRP